MKHIVSDSRHRLPINALGDIQHRRASMVGGDGDGAVAIVLRLPDHHRFRAAIAAVAAAADVTASGPGAGVDRGGVLWGVVAVEFPPAVLAAGAGGDGIIVFQMDLDAGGAVGLIVEIAVKGLVEHDISENRVLELCVGGGPGIQIAADRLAFSGVAVGILLISQVRDGSDRQTDIGAAAGAEVQPRGQGEHGGDVALRMDTAILSVQLMDPIVVSTARVQADAKAALKAVTEGGGHLQIQGQPDVTHPQHVHAEQRDGLILGAPEEIQLHRGVDLEVSG